MLRTLACVVALAIVVSGCSGESGGTKSAPTSAGSMQPPSADTGSVAVLLHDEEQKPVSGAQVALLDVPGRTFEGTTDPGGAFTFTGVPPGSFRLVAQQIGFEAAARRVDVVAGQVTEAKVLLKAVGVLESSYLTELVNGLLGCSVTVYTISQSTVPQPRLVCAEPVPGQNVYPNHKNDHKWTVPKGYKTHLAELDWRANAAGAKELLFLVAADYTCTPYVCTTTDATSKTASRPIQVRYDSGTFGKGPKDVKAKVFSGVSSSPTPTVVYVLDQKYTIYITNFFGVEMPEVWTATPPEPV